MSGGPAWTDHARPSQGRLRGGLINGLTLDVEEAFHASAFEDQALTEAQRRSRVERNTELFLELTQEAGVHGTCFVVGAVARAQPLLIKRLVAAGHELACHSDAHVRILRQSPEAFREDIRRARATLEALSGAPVTGYRAPTWSITAETAWALDILVEEGFTWDSSIFPVFHDRYGVPQAPRFPHWLETAGGQRLRELPPSTLSLLGVRLPVAGGGYLRLYPEQVSVGAIAYLNRVERQPALVYLHPWELDLEQPRLSPQRLRWWRHTVGIRGLRERLGRLLRRFRFGPLREAVPEARPLPTVRVVRSSERSGGGVWT